MPKFIPAHTPQTLDSFTRGYLEAMEWLLPEETNRNTLRGFTRAAIKEAKADCADFQAANADDLAEYEEISGWTSLYAGHDFYLSRNGHGAGFFDRGNEPVFKRLQDAARIYRETNEYVERGWIFP